MTTQQKQYFKADSNQRRPWMRFVTMLGAFLLPEFIRHAMSAQDRAMCLFDLLAAQQPPQNGTERGERIASMESQKSDFTVRSELLTLANTPEGAAALCGYLGLTEVPIHEVAEYNQYIDDEHNPARVDDAARPAATKAAHVRQLFSTPPEAPFGAQVGDLNNANKAGKRKK